MTQNTDTPDNVAFFTARQDRTDEVVVQTLEKIEELGLKPVPQVYELWFRYFQGDAEIVRAVDTHPGTLDETSCHNLYKKHLSEVARDDVVKKISNQVQSSISDLATMLVAARSDTAEYGGVLDDVIARIRSAGTLEELSEVVSDVVENTEKMMQKNQELELQLVSSSQQVTELRNNLDALTREALTDSLTGLSNRKAFDKHMRDALESADAGKSSVVLLLLDIDHFKKFNDSYGHQVGDQVLRLVARTLTDNVKGRDIAARYGGEEFAIILPDTPLAAGLKVAEALRKSVENKEVVNRATQQNLGRITLSAGVAEHQAGEDVASLIMRADTALYEAKKTGRNKVVEAQPATVQPFVY